MHPVPDHWHEDDCTQVHHQARHFRDSSNVLPSVFSRKPQPAVEPVPDVVPVEDVAVTALCGQLHVQSVCHCALPKQAMSREGGTNTVHA